MRYSLLTCLFAFALTAPAQTVLFSEDFDGSPAFAINTADQGGATASPDNTWLINNVYTGGSGSVICFGFPLPFSVGNTPGQPVGISNANGNYLHITSVAAQNSGILSCCFLAADGLCANAASHFARMTTDVATGAADITLSFWWLCAGGSNNYGEVYYSTNSGASWNLISTPISQYRNQSNWVQQSITLPAFSNQATLRFGFRFFNGTTTAAQDPAFAVDDVVITSAIDVPPSIVTSTITGSSFCQGAQLNVPYTITGSFTGGNVFTAQLSDASGSFASPTDIGSVASTSAGSIACTIPIATPPGSGYRIRVVSSAPALTGTDNGVSLTISAAPYAGPDGSVTLCKNSGTYNLLDYMTGASGCGAWTGPNALPFSGQLDTYTDPGGVYTYNTNCPGGCPQDQATLTVTLLNPANAGLDVSTALCTGGGNPPLVSYVNGGDATGIFFYNGQPTTNALLTAPGSYNVLYVVFGTSPCINDTAEFLFTVNEAPDAGSSTTVTICLNDPPVSLITLLGGTPDPGGVWTNPVGTPVSGTFTPGTSQPGLYTYTVAGLAPCADAQAFVAVVVDPCSGITEAAASEPLRYRGQQGTEHMVDLGARTAKGLEVFDALGAMRSSVTGPLHGLQRFDMGQRPAGIYFLRLAGDPDGQVLRFLHSGW